MSKWLPLTLAVAATATIYACTSQAPAEASAKAALTPEMEEQRQQVRGATRLWEENCSNCHGDKGQGGGAGTQTLLTKEKFDQKHDRPYFDAIKNGVPDTGMEPMGETMSDAEIWSLVVHIREMQARALRQQFGSPQAVNGVFSAQHHKFKVETVVDTDQGLRTPWSVDWLPDRRMLITNRPGFMFIAKDGKVGPKIAGLPEVIELGQGGLMDVAVHPDYAKNGWIYLAFTDPNGSGGGMTKIVRGKLSFAGEQATWRDQEAIFSVDKSFYNRSGVHFGSRIVFDGKGNIFFCIGERGSQNFAQDLTRPNGKVYRVTEDGKIPSDNPFVAQDEKTIKAIWSYGHRNPQGLALDSKGVLWDTEHAPRGGDEVNRVLKAANYGWPTVSFGINYNDSPFVTPWPKPDQNITMPVFRWLPSTGACGLDVMRGLAFPLWKDDLIAGGLVGENVDRIRVKDDKIVEREELIHGMGRVRDVACGPDGFIYLVMNEPDKVIRLVPAP